MDTNISGMLEYMLQGVPQDNYVTLIFEPVAFENKNGIPIYEQIIRLRGSIKVHGFYGFITGYTNIGTLIKFESNLANNLKGILCNCILPIVDDEAEAFTMNSELLDFIKIEFTDRWNAFICATISAPVSIEDTYLQMSFKFKLNLDITPDTICDLHSICTILEELYLRSPSL